MIFISVIENVLYNSSRFGEETITNKVNNYRNMLMGQGTKLDKAVDQWGRPM